MNKQIIKEFLTAIGAKDLQVNGDWVNCSCPLARWKHEKHQDTKPSFGVVVTRDGTALYRCFSCSPKAEPLEVLLFNLKQLSGKYYRQAAQILVNDASEQASQVKALGSISIKPEIEHVDVARPIPIKLLKEYFPRLYGHDSKRARRIVRWLEGRGVSEETFREFQIRFYTKSPEDAVAFPFTLRDGKIYALNVRSIKEKRSWYATGKSFDRPQMHIPGLSVSGAWFGMRLVNPKQPVILVEGPVDVMRLYELGQANVVASGGTSITKKQISKLPGPFITLALDADEAGRIAQRKLTKQMKGAFSIKHMDWSIVGCKDAGELKNKRQMQRALLSSAAKLRLQV